MALKRDKLTGTEKLTPLLLVVPLAFVNPAVLAMSAAAMTLPASTSAAARGAAAPSSGGIQLADLRQLPAVTVDDLLRRIHAPELAAVANIAPTSVASVSPSAETAATTVVKGSMPLSELTAAAPMTVADLLLRAGPVALTPDALPTAPAVSKVNVSQTKRQQNAAPLVVSVRIPAAPHGTPQAELAAPKATELPARHHADARLAAAPRALQLNIDEKGAELAITPSNLSFAQVGDLGHIAFQGRAAADTTIFVRDQKLVSFNAATGELRALQKGVTELYAFAKGHMYIVPLAVYSDTPGGSAGGNRNIATAPKVSANHFDLHVPDALVSLEGVVNGNLQSALFTSPGVATANAAAKQQAAVGNLEETAESGAASPADLEDHSPSLQDSVNETTNAMLRQANEAERFYNAKQQIGYTSLTVQVIDDRSDPEAGKIYPVAGATVHVVGTEFRATTDATGHLTIRDMPKDSRFLLRIEDPAGGVHNAVAEVSTYSSVTGVTRLRVLRTVAYDTFTSIAGVVPSAGAGSYCATVADKETPQSGVAVAVDAQAEGPFYFNSYGFLDRSLVATGKDGRFCFFNATPGPMALSLYEKDALLASIPISLYAGRHSEDRVDLSREAKLFTRLATMKTANEQLSNDQSSGSYSLVDMIDLIPLGTQTPMLQTAPGEVSTSDPLLAHHGRLRAYAQAAEFEPVVYSYNAADQATVTPLIPRGFVEDLALYAQVSHSPELGTVLAEYASATNAAEETIAMRLVDEYGRDVGDGWYFSDRPLTKAMFFNVPAGTYSLLVETKDGYWLSADTVIVYNETLSYLRLGGQVRRR